MRVLGLLLGAGMLSLAAGQADATIMLYLSQSGYADQSFDISSTGVYSGTYGTFNVRVGADGTYDPGLPNFSTNTIDTAAFGAGSLTVYLVQSGLTSYSGKVTSSFTVNGVGSPQVDETTYFAGAQIAEFNAVAKTLDSGYTDTDFVSATGPYTDATKFVVTATAGDRVNSTINITGSVPEPATWAMMLVGFGLIGATLRQRRPAKVMFG